MSDRKPMETNLCAEKRFSSSYDALNNMRRNNQLCDIEFTIGGKKISAHKAILASHSYYFNNMFTGNFKGSTFLEVKNTEITPNSFELLIDFLYTTKLTINDSNVQELLRASIVLILNDVKEECLKYIEQTIDIENFMTFIVDINKSRDLYELFLSYVLKNYKNIIVSDVFLTFSFELMMELIQSEDLCVKEEEAYESTILWLKHDLKERIKYLPELFKSIRLSLMTIDYLNNIVQDEDLIKSDITCMRHLCHGYKVHWQVNSMNNESSLTNNIGYRKYNQTSQSSLLIPENQNVKDNTIEKYSSTDDKFNQTKVHDRNNINVHEKNTLHLSNDDLAGRRDEKKKKNSQEHNDISDIDSSIDDSFNQTKVHDGNNINLHEEGTQHLSVNNDSKGHRNKSKIENSQKKNNISDIDSSVDDKLYPKKVRRYKKLIKKTSHQSWDEEQKYHKNVQKQNKWSEKDSIDDNMKQAHERKKIDSHKAIRKSEGAERLSGNEDHTNEGDNQYFCKDKKDSKNIICEKDSEKYELKLNKAHNINTIDLHEDIECKSLNDDEEGWCVQRNKKKKISHRSWDDEQKYHKNVQKQKKWSENDSIDDNMKQTHERKKIDSHKGTQKSEGAERPRDKYKNNNGQKQSRFSDECVLEEIHEDIFKLSKVYSLAHCVAEDLRMGEGIAVDFKNIFGGVGKLVDQKLKIGDVGIVKRHDQYAFYLVTKKTSYGKPTMITMEKALHSLLNKMKEYNLTKLGIPTIGFELDRLDWSDTKSLINKIFSGSGIHIVVCKPPKVSVTNNHH